jgi:hypothetical protein
MSESLGWTEFDHDLLQAMGIAVTDLWPRSEAELGRLARIKHLDGSETRKFHLTQDEAVEWLQMTMKLGDDLVIEDALRSAHTPTFYAG